MWRSLSTRGAGENGRMCCEGSHQRRAPMRSRRCSGPGRPLGDTKVSGRRVTCKAPLAHLEGGSGRSEVSPTAILQDTHSLEGRFCELPLYGVLRSSQAPLRGSGDVLPKQLLAPDADRGVAMDQFPFAFLPTEHAGITEGYLRAIG